MYSFIHVKEHVHRIIPSKFPPVSLFDWADSAEELEQIAYLEGLTNERILTELGNIHAVDQDDWIGGPGSTPVMAAFTHIGYESRFSDGSFGIYYAALSCETAIKETSFHRERFYLASHEKPCSISMREYVANVTKPLIDLNDQQYAELFHPAPAYYQKSQVVGKRLCEEKQWGLFYPSVRDAKGLCVGILRPPAITRPAQGCHLRYIWDGERISDVYIESKVTR